MRRFVFIVFLVFPVLGLAQGVPIGAGALSSIFSSKLAFQPAVNSTAPLSVAQIVDGAGYTTQIQVVNLDTGPVNYSLQFWDDSGNPLQLTLASGTASGNLPVGGAAFATTPGTATALTQGWGQATGSGRIGVLTIFKLSVAGRPDSEGTVTGIQSGNRVFLPFDNTSGYVTGMAVANTSTQTLSITLHFTTDSGAASQGSISLPPHAHVAFALTAPPASVSLPPLAGLRGSIELDASTPDIAVVGLRFSPTNSFTSLGAFQ